MRFQPIVLLAGCLALSGAAVAQGEKGAPKKKKKVRPFSWVSPLTASAADRLPPGVRHAVFRSESMGLEVGYYIYLPPGYDDPEHAERRYPVVYHLHGGRPGGEYKSVKLAEFVDDAVGKGTIRPTIYVWPNGGPMSWYNYPQIENGMGEDVFVKELVPHIDREYRTIGRREGRGLQGFSQGGRGTTRILFKHPELWGSTAPGGSGYEPEKRIQENGGRESETVRFAPGYNAWDLAKAYAERADPPPVKPMIWVGTEGFNYEYNLKFMAYLDSLGIPYEKLVVPGAKHSAIQIYERDGEKLLRFHDRNFRALAGNGRPAQ